MAKPDLHLAYYLILFTDVLGQRLRLRDLRALPETPEEWTRAVAVLKDTAGVLLALRQWFTDYFTAFAKPSEFVEHLRPPVREAMLQAKACAIACRHFSDSVTTSICLLDDGREHCTTINAVRGALVAACGMHVLALCAGKPIRSGIDVGLAMQLPEGDVYGPALERAVHLEARTAGYPRIAVGDELISYLDAVATQQHQRPFGAVAREVAQSCRRLVFQDTDGIGALDFLGEEFARDAIATIAPVLPKAYHFVKNAQVHWHQQCDEKLATRYDLLWAYCRSRAHCWGTPIEQLAADLDAA
jgi:hypothetical protein